MGVAVADPDAEMRRRCRIGAEAFVARVRGRPRGRPHTTGEGNHDMRLTVTTNVSVDGVMQGLGGADEDRRGGFDRGGWAIPLLDSEAEAHITEVYGGAAAFLFGRRTYEIFARSWGAIPEMSASSIGVALNSRPKYVVSASLTDPQWVGTSVLSGDVAAAVGDLKAQQDGELVVPGSGVLVRWLLANDLVDQLDLLTYPVVIGQGTRLFPDSGPDTALELVSSRGTSGGVTIQTYRLAGRPKYATAAANPGRESRS
jgi:dihydrofolate reductase